MVWKCCCKSQRCTSAGNYLSEHLCGNCWLLWCWWWPQSSGASRGLFQLWWAICFLEQHVWILPSSRKLGQQTEDSQLNTWRTEWPAPSATFRCFHDVYCTISAANCPSKHSMRRFKGTFLQTASLWMKIEAVCKSWIHLLLPQNSGRENTQFWVQSQKLLKMQHSWTQKSFSVKYVLLQRIC